MYEPEPLNPAPAPPPVTGTPVIREFDEDLVGALADDLFNQSLACVRTFGSFHLAVSGDARMERVLRRLLIDPIYRPMPWRLTHLWVADSGPDGEASDLLRDMLGDHADIPAGQFHAPEPGERASAAAAYLEELRESLGWRERGHDRLDGVLLCLGNDGSVTMNGPSTWQGDLVEHGDGGVSLAGEMINGARLVMVDVGDAHDGIARVVDGSGAGARLRPIGGEVRWYLSHDICRMSSGGGA